MAHHQRPSTSISLLNLARSGNDEAWIRITELYGPIIYSQCLAKGLNRGDAGDVTQEIFISIYQGLCKFEKNKEGHNFLGWVMKIASRRIVDHFRNLAKTERPIGGSTGAFMSRQVVHTEFDPMDIDANIDTGLVKKQLVSRALQIMKSDFATKTWQAFYLTLVMGQTTHQACEELDMKPGSVRQARARVRKRLIEELGDIL